MPIRDIGSNYRNKIKTIMDDIANILSSLNVGDYIKITYPSDKKIIYMRLDKIISIDSSFYNMQTYTGIIDLSFQGPAYLYTYDGYGNPVSLDCYNEYLLSNAINRNTAIVTDDPNTMEVINATIFHDDFITLFNKFYFNGYIWAPSSEMPGQGGQYPKDYAMTTYSFNNIPVDISGLRIPNTGEMKIDIIFQLPEQTVDKCICLPVEFKNPDFCLRATPDSNLSWEARILKATTDTWDKIGNGTGPVLVYENKYHMVFDVSSTRGNIYVYMEELRTGKSFTWIKNFQGGEDVEIENGTLFNNGGLEGTVSVGIERFRIWCEGTLLIDLVPMAFASDGEPVLFDLVSNTRFRTERPLPEFW